MTLPDALLTAAISAGAAAGTVAACVAVSRWARNWLTGGVEVGCLRQDMELLRLTQDCLRATFRASEAQTAGRLSAHSASIASLDERVAAVETVSEAEARMALK